MRYPAWAIASSLLITACEPAMQEPGRVRFTYLPADPPPSGAYRPTLPPAPAVRRCQLFDAASASRCLLETHDESAIPALLTIGVAREKKYDDEPPPFADDVSASVNAGRIAAATSPRQLLTMLADPDTSTEAFALAALASMLEAQAGTAAFEASAPATAKVCIGHVEAADVRVAVTAIACVQAAKQASMAPALARAFVAHPSSHVKDVAATALFRTPKGPLDEASLRAVAEVVAAPLTRDWHIADVRAREMGCMALAIHAGTAPWAIEAAAAASASMKRHGGSNGQNHPPSCETFAKLK